MEGRLTNPANPVVCGGDFLCVHLGCPYSNDILARPTTCDRQTRVKNLFSMILKLWAGNGVPHHTTLAVHAMLWQKETGKGGQGSGSTMGPLVLCAGRTLDGPGRKPSCVQKLSSRQLLQLPQLKMPARHPRNAVQFSSVAVHSQHISSITVVIPHASLLSWAQSPWALENYLVAL